MEKIYNKQQKVKIDKNQLCLCDSGKKYEQCCLNKNDTYLSLGQNYEKKDIIFNDTYNMKIYDDIANYGVKNIININANDIISVSKGLNFLRDIYSMADKGIKQFNSYAPCTKGCSHCCCLYLECTAIEAELIRRHLKETRTEEELNKIKDYIDKINNDVMTSDKSHDMSEEELQNMYYKYLKKNKQCMFLNKEGACSIYEVRPLRCRSFIVFSSREECEDHDEIVTPKLPPVYISNLVIGELSTKVSRFKKLSYVDKNGMIKPIKRCLAQWFKNGFNDINRQ